MTGPDHPRRELLFYLDQDADDEWRARMAVFVALLSDARNWISGPPTLMDEVDEADGPHASVETLGGTLDILSELPPDILPAELSRQQLDDVEMIVAAVAELSGQTKATFGFQLDGVDIGWVEGGLADHALQQGLLDEWRRRLSTGISPG